MIVADSGLRFILLTVSLLWPVVLTRVSSSETRRDLYSLALAGYGTARESG